MSRARIASLVNILLENITDSDEENSQEVFQKKRVYRKRKMWVRGFYQERDISGAFINVVTPLALSDPSLFRNYMRMTPPQFEELLSIVGPKIQKLTCIRTPIPPNQRLAITLRYLAAGESQVSLSYYYKCSPASVHNIVKETCGEIWNVLKPLVFPPIDCDRFREIASGFEEQWNFPHCIGAIDGKHILIEAPPRSGSKFFNYKKSHSLVLLAICDSNYTFTLCDIGAPGRQSDGGIFRNCEFGRKFINNELGVPAPEDISNNFQNMPYVFVADDAFALTTNMLKPFKGENLTTSQDVFNYRLSRARRVIENSFGILSSKWRIFRKPIKAHVDVVKRIVAACVCLHNWLRNQQESNEYINTGLVDIENEDGTIVEGEWRQEESSFRRLLPKAYNYKRSAQQTRENFSQYFSTEGAVPWQWDRI